MKILWQLIHPSLKIIPRRSLREESRQMSLGALLDPWNQRCHRAMTTALLFYASTELVCEYSPKSLEHRFSRQYTRGNLFGDEV